MEKYLNEHQAKELDLGPYIDAELVTAEIELDYDWMLPPGSTISLFAPDRE